MAYAISENDAVKAPKVAEGQDAYIKEMYLIGTKYYLYVHSYLRYGLLAARAEILQFTEDSGSPCIVSDFSGSYKYGGKEYKASHSPSGSGLQKCREVATKALKAGFVDPKQPVAIVRPVDFEDAAKRAYQTNLEEAKSIYPRVPYLCMDLVYQFTLLVDGFAIDPWQEITLVKKVEYRNFHIEAAWPLGSAIEAVSSLP